MKERQNDRNLRYAKQKLAIKNEHNQITKQKLIQEELESKKIELTEQQHRLDQLRAEWRKDLSNLKEGKIEKLITFSDGSPNDEPESLISLTKSI